jgi:3-phosphoshikimate 1-carboxyvinyltransferase
MPDSFSVTWPETRPKNVPQLHIPASKSQLNRYLILAALRPTQTDIVGKSSCDDVVHLIKALQQLGVDIDENETGYRVKGGQIQPGRSVDCGSGGTTLRFLMALAASVPGETRLKASAQLLARPHEEWQKELRTLGAAVRKESESFVVRGSDRWPDVVRVSTEVSSQFASALALVAASRNQATRIETKGEMVSKPYWDLTLSCIREFQSPSSELKVEVESDASSAAVWLAAQALGWPVHVSNYPKSSRQADTAFKSILSTFKKERKRDINLHDCPDLAPVLCMTAALLSGHTRIFGAEHLRFKESNRIDDLRAAFSSVGIRVEPRDDGFQIEGGQEPIEGTIDSHGDHRIAMAGCLSAAKCPVRIGNPNVVEKSYPEFWDHARAIGWKIQ